MRTRNARTCTSQSQGVCVSEVWRMRARVRLRAAAVAGTVCVILVLAVCVRVARAALIASGELRRCVQSGAGSDDVLGGTTCKDVIVVTLTVPANKVAATEAFTATVSAVSDPFVGTRKVSYGMSIAVRRAVRDGDAQRATVMRGATRVKTKMGVGGVLARA